MDQKIKEALVKERKRQEDNVELIASENYVSNAILKLQGSILTNKYAEGYPGKRYYGGCEHIDEIERLAINYACQLFNCKYANVQPHSGSSANMAVYRALLNEGATVTICHTKTNNLKNKTLNSDIIICACGSPKLLTNDMIKSGTIIIDAGITIIDGKIIGDVDFDNIKDKCAYITPNPGGVGPMTIAMIIENVLEAYLLQRKDDING